METNQQQCGSYILLQWKNSYTNYIWFYKHILDCLFMLQYLLEINVKDRN